MGAEQAAATTGAQRGWDCPVAGPRLREILESVSPRGIQRLILADGDGRIRLQVNRSTDADTPQWGGSSGMVEARAPVVVGRRAVAEVQALGAATTHLAAEEIVHLVAARLADAWLAAQEIDSLSGEVLRAYEELHLLYELGEALTDQLNVAQVADLILEKILSTLEAAWAELRLADADAPIHLRPAPQGAPLGVLRGGEQRLATTLCSGGQTLGSIVLVRPRDGAPFSSAEGKLLDAVGTFAASAIRNAQLRRQVDTDALTGLANHRAVQERLDQELAHARSHGHTLGLLIIDLDDFKLFNDTY